jgi:hypothetical protein
MKNRNIGTMILLTIVTFGIYFLVWSVMTAREMRRQGADIPNSILIIIPFANIWWTWKYSEGVEKVTAGKVSTILSFVLLYVAGFIGIYVVQYEFNKIGGGQAAVASGAALPPAAPVSPATPGQPVTNPAPPPEQMPPAAPQS